MPSIGFDLSKCQKEVDGGFHVGTKVGEIVSRRVV